MEHAINYPIEVEEGGIHQDVDSGSMQLHFLYHKQLIVNTDVKILLHGYKLNGVVLSSDINEHGDYSCMVAFGNTSDAFRLRMLEQAIRIEEFQKSHSELSLEEAAELWIEKNGSLFPER